MNSGNGDYLLDLDDHYSPSPEYFYDEFNSLDINDNQGSNDTDGDHDYAVQLQRTYDMENVETPVIPVPGNVIAPTRNRNRRRQHSRRSASEEDTTNDEAFARRLQEELDREELNQEPYGPNIRSIDISSLGDIPITTPRLRHNENVDLISFESPSRMQQHFINGVLYPGYATSYLGGEPTRVYDESDGAVLPEEITQQDLDSIICEFKMVLRQKHPEAKIAYIPLSSRNPDIMFTEFIGAIKEFREIDFILKPKIVFRNEPALDAGGVFNDTIRQILEIFMSLENPEYGGDGHLFTGGASKLISSTAPVHFVDELDAFGDVLFLAVIHNVPFPSDLDIILFKYCLSLENTITLDDLKGFSTPMYNLANNVYNAPSNVKLSTIEGFDQWAEEKEINTIQMELYSRSRGNLRKLAKLICEDVLINCRINQLKAINKKFNKFGFFDVLKAKRIRIEDIKNYFYREIITPNDIIKKLMFDEVLNPRQDRVRTWLIDWLKMQEKEKLQEFCRLVTGFKNPREGIKVSFKPQLDHEPREIQLTPKFVTCFQELKLSERFSSRQELYTIMNAQVDQTIHDNRFTTA